MMSVCPSAHRFCHRRQGRIAPRVLGVAALLLAALAMAPAWSDDRGDHERARQAVKAGDVLPLPVVLERLKRDHPGDVLEVKLERERGHWIYEVRLLQAGGGLVRLKLDAGTGALMRKQPRDRSAADNPR